MIGTPIIAAQPIASSNASSSDDCLLVGWRRSTNPSPCYTKRIEGYVEKPTVSAFIQTFKDLPQQAQQLLTRLRAISIPKEIIVNDDSHGKQSAIWLPLLTNLNEFYICLFNSKT